MLHKLLPMSRLHSVNNFNYFFHNTKRCLINSHVNFINNQYLTRQVKLPRISQTKRNSSIAGLHDSSVAKDFKPKETTGSSTVLENVASKVLTCQEPEAKLSQSLTSEDSTRESPNIPFKVSPKAPRRTKVEQQPVSILTSKTGLRDEIRAYVKLTKPNLTVLVTLSCICSYAISPLSVSFSELLFLTAGTALSSGAANAINMGREPDFDKQMPRTMGRPVVRGLITPQQAYNFAALIGTTGVGMLYYGVNPIVASLGFFNIVLYAWIYTSMKRKSILNTWVGAIVGAIPPLMGWAASSSLWHPGAWCLAGLLYAWQFPHFNALSHGIAQQYKQAGDVMTAAENPKLNARVALRYSILMFPLCFGLSYFGVTDWVFPFDSAIADGWQAYLAFKFWQQQLKNYKNPKGPTSEGIALAGIHAKKLFWCSVWHLPAVLILAMLHKKDQWDRLYNYLF